MPISNSQKALLHVAKSKLKLADAACRQILVHVAGVTLPGSPCRVHVAGFTSPGSPCRGHVAGVTSWTELDRGGPEAVLRRS